MMHLGRFSVAPRDQLGFGFWFSISERTPLNMSSEALFVYTDCFEFSSHERMVHLIDQVCARVDELDPRLEVVESTAMMHHDLVRRQSHNIVGLIFPDLIGAPRLEGGKGEGCG